VAMAVEAVVVVEPIVLECLAVVAVVGSRAPERAAHLAERVQSLRSSRARKLTELRPRSHHH